MVSQTSFLYPRPDNKNSQPKKAPLHFWGLGPVESGQRTVIHALNQTLGWPITEEVTMPELFYRRFHATMEEVARVYGPDALQRAETSIITEVARMPTDTMLPLEDELPGEAIDTITHEGVSVWFDCNPEELAARSMSDENAGKTSHPFLRGLPLSERQRIFEKIIADRRAMYERAHIHITTGNKSVHTIVEEILGHPLMEKFRD